MSIASVTSVAPISDLTYVGAGASTTNKKLRYVDMNAGNGGVARNTLISNLWVDVFSYAGTGFVFAFMLNLETFDKWAVRLIIDDEEIFGPDGLLTSEVRDDVVYDFDNNSYSECKMGISKNPHDVLAFQGPLNFPIRYDASVVIKVKRMEVATKKFQAGLISMSKDT